MTSPEDGRVDEEAWGDLRARHVRPIVGRAVTAQAKQECFALSEQIAAVRHDRLAAFDRYDDVDYDLGYAARARATGEPSPFFELLVTAYRAGYLPVGWDGKHPAGRLIVVPIP